MMEPYLCLAQPAEHEIVVKKSRFICNLIPVETEREAREALAAIKKKHYDARHNCYAMSLGGNIKKSSDDGEPQGTAGVPMLEVLSRSGITNILAVVTRYFGGTLLGAGGLVRAYGASVSQALAGAKKEWHIPAAVLRFTVEYADYSKLQSIAAEFGARVEAEYGEQVAARMVLRLTDCAAAEKRINEAFLGAKVYERDGECFLIEAAE